MASNFQQKVQLRKLIYAALMLALFTGSYLYRKYVVEQQAYALQLRETARGEVNLASSAIRLLLTGSRGLAATVLWNQALDLRERHKWNELELVVNSITKLQPYFVSPWVFQSWNMAFNVAVECDKPRDKYYYIARGIDLLAEGERRHRGVEEQGAAGTRIEFPGNPEMRFYLGFFLLRKIGFSDEQNTMRSLLDMSCIDPVERDPNQLWAAGEYGRSVNKVRFERFCKNYPRLVRRLREQLGYIRPEQIVTFLEENSNIPSRFEEGRPLQAGEQRVTPLKSRYLQWPILPPPRPSEPLWPNSDMRELSNVESADVFVVARTWFKYSQEPLPPPNNKPTVDPGYNLVRYRVPKNMMTVIFRSYPARVQAYVAENLEAEGWFDEDGWLITEWFDPELQVGTEPKYHAGPAWNEARDRYVQFGIENGLHGPDRVENQKMYRTNVNYDNFLDQCHAEGTREALFARKLFYLAEQKRLEGATPEALNLYDQAMPFWTDAMLTWPHFRGDTVIQEQTYENQRKYNSAFRDEQAGLIRKVSIGLHQMTSLLHPPFEDLLLPSQKPRIAMACLRAPLEATYYYDLPRDHELQVKNLVAAWLQAAKGPAALLPAPGQQSRVLTVFSLLKPQNPAWRPVLPPETGELVRSRYGIAPTAPTQSGN